MLTASEVFQRAVKIMDEQNDSGEAMWEDTVDYQNRAIDIMNILIPECYQYSDTIETEEGVRPVPSRITSFEDSIDLDDIMAGTVLPYGLAAQLCMDDNPRISAFSQQRYEELMSRFARNFPSKWDVIPDSYGIQHNSFGRW